MLLADSLGAELIVAVGTHATLVEFLDKGRKGMASTFLTRLRVGSKLVDAKGVSLLYRSRISTFSLVWLVLAGLAYWFWREPATRLLLLGYFLLVLRLSFDVFVFPARLTTSPEVAYRAAAIRVGRETSGRPLVLWPGAQLDNVEAYYIARERGQTLATGTLPPRPGTLYLAEAGQLSGQRYRLLDEFTIDRGLVFQLVEFP